MLSFNSGRRSWAVIGMLQIMAFSAPAQQPLSLQTLEDASAKYSPVLHQRSALVDASKASVRDVQHSFLPTAAISEQLNTTTDNSLAGSYFTMGSTASTSGGIRADNNLQAASGNLAVVNGQYTLLNFGLNSARLTTARSFVDLQNADLNREQYSLQLQVARLYFNILKSQERLDADRQNVERYTSILTEIEALTSAGIKPGADSSLAKAELSKTKITFNQTVGEINQLKEQLAYLTGIPAPQLILDSLSNHSTSNNLQFNQLLVDTVNNPYIIYYEKKKAVLLSEENLVKKSFLPRVDLVSALWARGSSIQYNDQYKSLITGWGYQRYNYAVGLTISYNLFNAMYKKDKLAIARYETSASDYELQQQKLALNSAASQASQALQTTLNNLEELPVQLQSAQAVYYQKLAQYRAGLISLIDLTNASFVLYRSQTDYIETIHDWYLAQLDKAAATGTLSQFIQLIK